MKLKTLRLYSFLKIAQKLYFLKKLFVINSSMF